MLIFDRPGFKAGIMIIEDRVDGNPIKMILRPHQRGGEIAFSDEEYVKQKYPAFFVDAAGFSKRKDDRRKNKEQRKKLVF